MAPPPPPAPEPQPTPRRFSPPVAAAAPPTASPSVIFYDSRPPSPEIKFEDLYCSGFVRKAKLPKDLKVIARFDASGAVLASDSDYVYLSHGSEDGITAGGNYQVVRPTKTSHQSGRARLFHERARNALSGHRADSCHGRSTGFFARARHEQLRGCHRSRRSRDAATTDCDSHATEAASFQSDDDDKQRR